MECPFCAGSRVGSKDKVLTVAYQRGTAFEVSVFIV